MWPANNPPRVDRYGNIKVGPPQPINVRWTNQKRLSTAPDGQTITTDADVLCDTAIPVQSILRLGGMDEIPDPIDKLYRVMALNETPDLKNRESAYSVSLSRSNDTLPESSV